MIWSSTSGGLRVRRDKLRGTLVISLTLLAGGGAGLIPKWLQYGKPPRIAVDAAEEGYDGPALRS